MYTVRFLSEKYCHKYNISISPKTLRCNNVRFWSKQRCQEGNVVATFLQRCRMSRPNNNQKPTLSQRRVPAGWETNRSFREFSSNRWQIQTDCVMSSAFFVAQQTEIFCKVLTPFPINKFMHKHSDMFIFNRACSLTILVARESIDFSTCYQK